MTERELLGHVIRSVNIRELRTVPPTVERVPSLDPLYEKALDDALETYNLNATPAQIALWSLHNSMTTDARDWAADRKDAWHYGLIVGWGDALDSVGNRHRWAVSTRTRLAALHLAIAGTMGKFPVDLVQW